MHIEHSEGTNLSLSCNGVWKIFQRGRRTVQALKDVTIAIRQGEFIALTGPSGSGKSTLLDLLGGLDLATSGQVSVFNVTLDTLSSEQRSRLRRHTIGFVFQDLRLIAHLTAIENVILPMIVQRLPLESIEQSARSLLSRFNLADRLDHFPYELSYGEQQRVAIVRSLITNPEIILADEPTANLDDVNTTQVLEIFHALLDKKKTVIVATHDPRVVSAAHRVIRLTSGAVRDGVTYDL